MTTRFNLLLSGPAHDIFALDVYYHKRCYTNFVREKEVEGTTSGAEIPGRCEGVKEDFLRLISKKILQEKKAYFLTELIHDIAERSPELIGFYGKNYIGNNQGTFDTPRHQTLIGSALSIGTNHSLSTPSITVQHSININ